MKKLSLTAILMILVNLFYSCGIGLAPRIDLDTNRQDLMAVVGAAQTCFTESKTEDEHLILDLSADTFRSDGDISTAAEKAEALGFDFLWVCGEYVIFWEDEAKVYGLLYADSPKSVIKELCSWYSQMEYNKIEKNWYEIGQLSTI